jgi:hypothetical protein
MTAHTIHGIGYGCLVKHVGYALRIDDRKYRMLMRAWIERNVLLHQVYLKQAELSERIEALTRLVHFARLTLTPAQDLTALGDLAARFDLLLPDAYLPGVGEVLDQGEELSRNENVIDFADMLWLPVWLKNLIWVRRLAQPFPKLCYPQTDCTFPLNGSRQSDDLPTLAEFRVPHSRYHGSSRRGSPGKGSGNCPPAPAVAYSGAPGKRQDTVITS